ncbi:MAG: CehA/McbA family metallohydrolase [Chloroflexota bacterium]
MRIRIDGTLDYRQQKQHIPFAFTVAENATQLNIKFDYAPKSSQGQTFRNDLSLTLFDPERARGARHNNPDRNLTITESWATPGYTPGKLLPGIWTVFIDTHRVLPPDVINYWFEIEISHDPVETRAPFVKAATAPRGAGWYRGDLHGHSLHSDARREVSGLAQYARDYKLDFVTLSDHNTVSGTAELDSLAGDDLLTMGGMELTTYYGHCLALGIRHWVEWRMGVNGATMPQLVEKARSEGATFIIAHPNAQGDPWCTGCDWGYPDMMPGNARCVEVWNSAWDSERNNEGALALWYQWLNQGYRMVGTRGTDIHGQLNYTNVGFNIVYADELSESAILRAIRQGHLYISAQPKLDLRAAGNNGTSGMVGDLVGGETVEVSLKWENCAEGDHLRLVVNGVITEDTSIAEDGERNWTLSAAEARWCVVEIRGANGEMHAVTNPIFLGDSVDWK